jgi:hypothetical protein
MAQKVRLTPQNLKSVLEDVRRAYSGDREQLVRSIVNTRSAGS